MVNLGPIDFQIWLPPNINVNDRQNKFEVHISKNIAKNSQGATFATTLNGHYSTMFHPILTLDTTKMISSLKQIEWC